MIREKTLSVPSGWPFLIFFGLAVLASLGGIIYAATRGAGLLAGLCAALAALFVFLLIGLFIVNPNEGRVLQLFGRYVGTSNQEGLRWANPLFTKKRISLRARNFESGKLKVNDRDGNPIEIAAVVVWRVVDTAEAVFQVDDYQNYVKVQTESAVRNLAMSYPYDTHEDHQFSLRGNPGEIADHLRKEIQERLTKAGVDVTEARIVALAYAPEIAMAMLRRQQAGAVIAARQRIVEGSVGMVEMALERLSRHKVLELDEERKAAMVSNLLVVLCSESATQPVVNTGTLHH